MKPLFIPLKTEFYEAFENGSKDTEYRVYGPRWNERTCPPGRPVVLSKGYGKAHRLAGYIESFLKGDVPVGILSDWIACYGNNVRTCAMIRIQVPTTDKT